MTFMSYSYGKRMVTSEISKKMTSELDDAFQKINNSLSTHSMVAKTLAKTAQTSGTTLNKSNYEELLKQTVSTNSETFGAGIWFEPYKYKNDINFFGPYAYRNNSNIVYTDDYSKESYNYPQYDWYKIGQSTSKSVEWTSPYYDDVTKITMVTASVPFYDSNNKFMGVTTASVPSVIELVTLEILI
jgi:methyl-accepting chemotaxis protein